VPRQQIQHGHGARHGERHRHCAGHNADTVFNCRFFRERHRRFPLTLRISGTHSLLTQEQKQCECRNKGAGKYFYTRQIRRFESHQPDGKADYASGNKILYKLPGGPNK